MIDFAWFDIALLAAVALRYVIRPERVVGVFHDPFSATALGAGLFGAADVGAAASAPVAAAALAPEIAGGAAALAPEIGGAAALGGVGALGGADALTTLPVAFSTFPTAAGIAGGPLALDVGFTAPAASLAEGGAIGAGVGGAEAATAGTFAGAGLGAGLAGSSIIDPATAMSAGSALMAPATSAPIAAPTGPSAASFGVSAPTTMPATSATPLASATGGGVPAADATQVAAAPGGGVTDASGGADVARAAAQPGVGTTNATTTAAKAAAPTDIGSKIIDFAKKNPGLLLSAAPALLSMFGKPSEVPGQAQLQNQQLQAASMGKTLSAFQLSGTLPAGMQEIVNAKNAADKAAIRSNFAQLGYTGSTAERQALAQTDQATTAQIASIGAQLASQGLDWTHISSQELETLLNAQLKQQSDFSAAIGNLAKGLVPIGSAVDKAIAAP